MNTKKERSEHMGVDEIIETQNEIIRMQSKVIDDIFLLLSQHIAADEIDNIPCIEKINMIAGLKKDIERR